MKKLLSVLLVIAMAATLFAGCNQESDPTATPSSDPTATPSASAEPSDPTPTPSEPSDDVAQVPTMEGGVIEFNLYDQDNYMAYWGPATVDKLLADYQLKIGLSIVKVQESDIGSEAGRMAYTLAIKNLFNSNNTKVDFFPALLSSNVGTDATFKALGEEGMLVDFNDYLGEGKALENYINNVWDGNEEYWNSLKASLLAADGGLYALPRREKLSMRYGLSYNRETLEMMGEGWNDWWEDDALPTDWDDFVDFLTYAKSVRVDDKDDDKGHAYVPFSNVGAKLDTILPLIAASYGLEWNANFDWTTKNGEPLWTYAWDEYKLILEELLEWVENGLILTDCCGFYKGEGKVVAGYNMNYDSSKDEYDDMKKLSERMRNKAMAMWEIPQETFGPAKNNSHRDTITYKLSTVIPSQDGYESTLYTNSDFDTQYYAISTRLGEEFALRMMKYMNDTMTDEGYFNYAHGREGIPFADTRWEAGNYVWIEDHTNQYGDEVGKRMAWSVGEDHRYERMEALGYTVENFWSQLDTMEGYGGEKYKYADFFLVDRDPNYGTWSGGEYKELTAANGSKAKFWCGRGNYMMGLNWYADVTDYKMQYTVYWETECFAHDINNWYNMIDEHEEAGKMVYVGLFATPSEVLTGMAASDMTGAISELKQLAKEYTLRVLGAGDDSGLAGWTTYLRNVKDAGYMDVFNFYDTTEGNGFQSSYDATIKSSTWMHEESENAGYFG